MYFLETSYIVKSVKLIAYLISDVRFLRPGKGFLGNHPMKPDSFLESSVVPNSFLQLFIILQIKIQVTCQVHMFVTLKVNELSRQ